MIAYECIDLFASFILWKYIGKKQKSKKLFNNRNFVELIDLNMAKVVIAFYLKYLLFLLFKTAGP